MRPHTRSVVRVALLAVAACLALAGPAAARPLSLRGCVEQWNRAEFGDGHLQIKGVAANGRRALMVAFADGACGIFFTDRQGEIGGVGEFAVGLHGAYVFGAAPFTGGSATAIEHLPGFRAAAAHPNVIVSLKNGHVRPLHGARTVHTRLTAIDTADDCARITTVEGDGFDLTRRSVGCALARVLISAWTAGDGKPIAPDRRRILDWRCERSSGGLVSCASSERKIEARPEIPRIVLPHP